MRTFCMCYPNAHAEFNCKGTVTDETGESLPGGSIVVKGTTNGTVTDLMENTAFRRLQKIYYAFTYIEYGGTRYKSCRTENDQYYGDEG
ncbi:carboxypeptidase-like regulatory domain-containing protein [Bacteroides thetaiotaomicron]|uniref:carboxypeptidase-like regulatory domain-containing protein n=1 Tax=Bacteroides thetaiotaomicron TaxID=818 RepID=UPI0021660E26|nr:carboxypeptidase-like regulatory domain-containing protein [Bacteroides thetaiotaomicron]MCS2207907.1 carboxypeptidase-like regulatory domain-containing protein [Bacteroides thetaiotaomicron]